KSSAGEDRSDDPRRHTVPPWHEPPPEEGVDQHTHKGQDDNQGHEREQTVHSVILSLTNKVASGWKNNHLPQQGRPSPSSRAARRCRCCASCGRSRRSAPAR